jgi:predicted RNase H-like HicB family nuclease
MKRQFTSVIEKRGKWYVGFVEEIPGVNTQGKTLTEVRRNLKEALTLIIETNKELAARERTPECVREEIIVNI